METSLHHNLAAYPLQLHLDDQIHIYGHLLEIGRANVCILYSSKDAFDFSRTAYILVITKCLTFSR